MQVTAEQLHQWSTLVVPSSFAAFLSAAAGWTWQPAVIRAGKLHFRNGPLAVAGERRLSSALRGPGCSSRIFEIDPAPFPIGTPFGTTCARAMGAAWTYEK
jgi:hypothetical protein